MIRLIIIVFFFVIVQSKAYSSTITYKEILDNPTELELNLNYAKQQEKAGWENTKHYQDNWKKYSKSIF